MARGVSCLSRRGIGYCACIVKRDIQTGNGAPAPPEHASRQGDYQGPELGNSKISINRRIRKSLQGQGLRAQLLRGGMGSVAVKVVATGLSFAVAVILARVLGPEGYGVYAFAFALISLLAIPSQFGLPNLVIRETAKAHANDDWGLMRGIWRWANGVAGTISVTLALIAGAIAWIFAGRFNDVQLVTFAWGLALIPLIALGALSGAALRGLRKVVAGQMPEFVLRPLFLILLVLAAALLWPDGELTAATTMAFHALAAALAFSLGAWMLTRARPEPLMAAPEPVYRSRAWAASALPLALLAGMQMVNQHADILMLGLFRNAEEVGVYRVVVQGGTLVVFGLQAVGMVVAPQFARLHSIGDTAGLQRVATLSARTAAFIALPVTLVFLVLGGAILGWIFGPAFAAGRVALAIIALGQLVNAAVGPVGILLNMTGHERITARGVGIATGCNVILNLILIPPLGMNGAALATALTLLIWNWLLWQHAKTQLNVLSDPLAETRTENSTS